jgi:hypothetical protein
MSERVWAIEGTGSFGAGVASYLLEQGEWVVEVDRPARPARRNGAKSDQLDAARAATKALSRTPGPAAATGRPRSAARPARCPPRSRLARTQAIGQVTGLIINAPDQLRQQLRRLRTDEQLARCTP